MPEIGPTAPDRTLVAVRAIVPVAQRPPKSALAIFATPWLFDTPLMVSGALTAVAIIYLWWLFRRGGVDARWLWPVGLLYGVFAAYVAWHFAST